MMQSQFSILVSAEIATGSSWASVAVEVDGGSQRCRQELEVKLYPMPDELHSFRRIYANKTPAKGQLNQNKDVFFENIFNTHFYLKPWLCGRTLFFLEHSSASSHNCGPSVHGTLSNHRFAFGSALAIMARRPEILRRACLKTPLSNSCSFSFYFVLLAVEPEVRLWRNGEEAALPWTDGPQFYPKQL
jgi:hypothetical protein